MHFYLIPSLHFGKCVCFFCFSFCPWTKNVFSLVCWEVIKVKCEAPTNVSVFLCLLQNMEDMEKSHESFLQGAQQELRKEMATLQKKILMDTVSLVSVKINGLMYKVLIHTDTNGKWCPFLLSVSIATAGDGHSPQVSAVHVVLGCCYHGDTACCSHGYCSIVVEHLLLTLFTCLHWSFVLCVFVLLRSAARRRFPVRVGLEILKVWELKSKYQSVFSMNCNLICRWHETNSWWSKCHLTVKSSLPSVKSK